MAGGGDMQRFQVLDLLTLLVDKSLVVALNPRAAAAERVTDCWRRCASTRPRSWRSLARRTPCGLAIAITTRRWPPCSTLRADSDFERRVEQAEMEIDNLRAAFGWSRENRDAELALALASSLQPLWLGQGRIREGLAWFDAAFADAEGCHLDVAPAARARALADKVALATWAGDTDCVNDAEQALAIARDLDDPALLARALTARGFAVIGDAELAAPYFGEAIGLVRELGDRWRLSQILVWQARRGTMGG